jgi:hypothetical protein
LSFIIDAERNISRELSRPAEVAQSVCPAAQQPPGFRPGETTPPHTTMVGR